MFELDQQDRAAWAAALCGQRFGDYETSAYIGGGGFAFVYQATQLSTRTEVALKVLVPNSVQGAVEEFSTEGELLDRLRRASGVVTIVETGQETAQVSFQGMNLPLPIYFHAMELASGCLEELLAQRDELSWLERLQLWRGVILGVHQMHLRRIAHRDLKSGNCLLFIRRKQETACKVSDLGRSRDLTRPARYDRRSYLIGRGDLRFAPPEFLWLQGEETPEGHRAADLYGVGSVLFELATGVGLTQMALGFGPELIEENASAASLGQGIDLAILSSKFEAALDIFADELPPVIRHDGRALLKQLVSPDPASRWPRIQGRRVSRTDGLEWLFRPVDILIKRLQAEQRENAGRPRRKAAS